MPTLQPFTVTLHTVFKTDIVAKDEQDAIEKATQEADERPMHDWDVYDISSPTLTRADVEDGC